MPRLAALGQAPPSACLEGAPRGPRVQAARERACSTAGSTAAATPALDRGDSATQRPGLLTLEEEEGLGWEKKEKIEGGGVGGEGRRKRGGKEEVAAERGENERD
ncbi:hypothetical protein PR202_gb07958 [Eleusine coracana subsp. coracana]|uniref:Uncharacterized protein n=1 Tax=Eleusine coracana subsp. coracana TaxID=191504 RepID=A0AAV5EEH7_ELECO|nr:hypothetical protein PR202_gb07958 [Eleusine coracana subsp. coracana]